MAPSSGMVDPLLKSALRMGIRLGRAAEFHSSADIISALVAIFAVLAWLTDFEGDSIPSCQCRDARTNSNDRSARLMAKRQWLTNNNIAISVMVEIVQIGTTEAGGLDSNLNLVGRGGS